MSPGALSPTKEPAHSLQTERRSPPSLGSRATCAGGESWRATPSPCPVAPRPTSFLREQLEGFHGPQDDLDCHRQCRGPPPAEAQRRGIAQGSDQQFRPESLPPRPRRHGQEPASDPQGPRCHSRKHARGEVIHSRMALRTGSIAPNSRGPHAAGLSRGSTPCPIPPLLLRHSAGSCCSSLRSCCSPAWTRRPSTSPHSMPCR